MPAHEEITSPPGPLSPGTTLPFSRPLTLGDQLTVEAWVEADDARLEGMQALVSQWRPPDAMDRFAAHDAAGTDGLNSTGYFGAVFDGRYVYFAAEMHGDRSTHAQILRYDTQGPFNDPDSYAAYDAGATDGLDVRGFYGAVFDGRYVYFVPRQLDMDQYHSRILRLDTLGDFSAPSSWNAYDVGEAHSQQSAAFDGRYIYFSPGFYNDPKSEADYSGQVIRADTQGPFKNPASYTSVDLTRLLDPRAACFDGAAFDGRYIYLVPLYDAYAVRYDSRSDFADPTAWEGFAADQVGMGANVGAVFDGRHLYYCAYGHDRIVRFDTQNDFTDPTAWQSRSVDHTDGLRTTGFDGGFFDGRFVYFQPFFVRHGEQPPTFHSHYLRYDPSRDFADPASWQAHDASATDGLHSVGYNGGVFDGRYFYAAPWQQGPDPDDPDRFITHATILRCDTLGNDGAFSLRYCDYGHNGGLNAAAPGPSFLVNTQNGVLSVAAHRALPPGPHHLAGTYDGATLKLYIDGELTAQREGQGLLVDNALPVVLGQIQDGQAHFRGRIKGARLLGRALDPDAVRASAQTPPA
ncbi:MAG: hypothetical protein GKR89_16440 [Candidatus Latescibacteria bacterium]|nr:hypothetical protein [Candidatus Latescibacterota bacterium]